MPYKAPNPYYLVPTILLLVIFIGLTSVKKSHLSDKTKKLVTILNLSLMTIIILLFVGSFIINGPVGNFIANTTMNQTMGSASTSAATLSMITMASIIAILSAILMYIERDKIKQYLDERHKKHDVQKINKPVSKRSTIKMLKNAYGL